jgi:hypothetical protein
MKTNSVLALFSVVILTIFNCSAANAADKIYWGDAGDINHFGLWSADADGSNPVRLSTTQVPDGIAVDRVAGYIFWSVLGGTHLYRNNLDGSGEIKIIDGLLLDGTQEMALDIVSQRIYFSHEAATAIIRIDYDGSNVVVIQSGATIYNGISLDVAGGKIYWSETDDVTNGMIRRSNLNGTAPETLHTSVNLLDNPVSLAVDPAGGKMYWTTQCDGRVRRANLNGTGVENVATALVSACSFEMGIAIATNKGSRGPSTFKLFYADDETIFADDLTGGNQTVLYSETDSVPYRLVVTNAPGPSNAMPVDSRYSTTVLLVLLGSGGMISLVLARRQNFNA